MADDELLATYASWTTAAFEAAGGPAGFARLIEMKALEHLEAERARALAAGDVDRAAGIERDIIAWRRYEIPSGTRSSWRPTASRPRPTAPPPQLRAFFEAAVVELVPVNPASPEAYPNFQTVLRRYAQQQAHRVGRPPRHASPAEQRRTPAVLGGHEKSWRLTSASPN